jgi:hypothetical protein
MANEFELSFQGSATLYVTLRRQADAAVYDGQAFVTWDDDDLPEYALPMTSKGGDIYQADFPADVAQGGYRALYYLQAGQTPDTDDLLLATRSLHWTGLATDAAPDDDDLETGVNDSALTSVANVTAYLRLASPSSDDQTLLAMLVNQISARIERICGRSFHAQDRIQRDVRSMNHMAMLRHFPVQKIYDVKTGRSAALHAQFTNDALLARLSVHYDTDGLLGQLTLKSIASDGTETLTTLTMADHVTTTDMATAINQVQGWSAQAVAAVPSDQLLPAEIADALDQDATIYYPDLPVTDWELHPASGTLQLHDTESMLIISYRAGYEAIPADLVLIATELVAQAYEQSRISPGVKSETLGDYSYTLATQSQMTRDLWSRLRLYMEVR